MAPEVEMTIVNGPKSSPVSGRLEVNGRIRGTSEGFTNFEVKSQNGEPKTESIWFRGTVTGFSFDGQGAVTIAGDPIRAKNVPGYDTRRHESGSGGGSSGDESGGAAGEDGSSGGDSGAGTGGSGGGDDTPRGSGAGIPDDTINSTDEYRRFFDLPIPNSEERRVKVEQGTYKPGAIQRTLLYDEPRRSVEVVGNPSDPYSVDVSRANHNFTVLVKDEHFWLEGMLWGRTQFSGSGNPYCRDMAFTDRHGKGQSAVGGKSAVGRFIRCDIGHKTDPDTYSAYYYGGGSAHFDRKNVFRASGPAYIGVNNTVTLYIDGSCRFASGDKPVVEGSGVYPEDLHGGINKIEAGERR